MIENGRKYPGWLVSLLLLVLPPVAFVLMWKDKTCHKWFVWMSWVFGGFLVLYFLFLNYVLVPQINTSLIAVTGKKVSFGILDWIGVLGLGLVQFGLGFLFRKKIKESGSLTTIWLIVAIALLVADYIVPSMVYSKILTPIYSSILP